VNQFVLVVNLFAYLCSEGPYTTVFFGFNEFGVGFGELVWWIWLCGVVMRWCCGGEVLDLTPSVCG
jgi:hypothetical protein